ncbi:uncharacterized protein LOC124140595 [Haliotis rufescens]|uniref:uncharacterized protein LOC124140595 n=1 Tax=Haliotis rufescens TaxID=6454 RepID=UPI00201F7B3B|nr:uncharacterized protein LOC124140595 [Haliotis rufescens]
MMHGFENKRVTEHVMWVEENTESLLECAARCGQHDLAVTCGYNPNTLECVAYSARFTDPSTVAYVDNSKYRMYSLNLVTVTAEPPLGICDTSDDCPVVDTECMEGECVCNITQVFSYAVAGCVQGCSQYSKTFTKFAGRVIWEHDDLLLGTLTEDECQAACVIETSIVCKTAQYSPVTSLCVLSSSGWLDVDVSDRATRESYNIHIRHCDF